jgi:predicted nucleic acid-binding protein
LILVDTSAWIEYLRATSSAEHIILRGLIERDAPLATTDPVVMELLAGARDDSHLMALRRFVNRFENLPVQSLADFEHAADVYRRCRRAGETPRSLTDCLVISVALREGVPLLARDRDFEKIAGVTGAKLHRPG